MAMVNAQTRQGHDVPIPPRGNLDFAESARFCERRDPADVHDDAARARGLAVAEAWRSDLAIAEAER